MLDCQNLAAAAGGCRRGSELSALEAEVNERVCRLFGLTRAEIALIEEAT